MQFSLRQLLIAVAVVAIGLVLLRFAIQSHGIAVGLVVVLIAAVILLIANLTIYAALRGFGLLFGMEPVDKEEGIKG